MVGVSMLARWDFTSLGSWLKPRHSAVCSQIIKDNLPDLKETLIFRAVMILSSATEKNPEILS